MDVETILIRFGITFLLALVFGFERQRSHKPIGFGTFIFVAIGSCGLGIIALSIPADNPLVMLGAIVTGIGFLGAGALIKATDKIFGFTTAASIWVFAIFGLMIGLGEYLMGSLTYGAIWFVVLFDRYLEAKAIGSYQRRLVITTCKLVSEKEIKDMFLRSRITKYKLITTFVEKPTTKLSKTYLIEGRKEDINKIPQNLLDKDWFESCKLE